MLLTKKWVERDGIMVIRRRNSPYINNIQRSLIFGVFAPRVSFVRKYAQNKKACCQEKLHPRTSLIPYSTTCKVAVLFSFFIDKTQCCTNGCAEFTVLRNDEIHAIQLLQATKYGLALRQKREVADEDKVLNARPQRRQDGAASNGLQYHGDDSQCYVFARGVALGVAKE